MASKVVNIGCVIFVFIIIAINICIPIKEKYFSTLNGFIFFIAIILLIASLVGLFYLIGMLFKKIKAIKENRKYETLFRKQIVLIKNVDFENTEKNTKTFVGNNQYYEKLIERKINSGLEEKNVIMHNTINSSSISDLIQVPNVVIKRRKKSN